MQRARQRRLKAHAVSAHPCTARRRSADDQARKMFVGVSCRHFQQVLQELFLGIRIDQHILGRIVHAAQVARVRRVAATPLTRRRFDQQHARSCFSSHQRCAKRRVATADYKNIMHREALYDLRAERRCIHFPNLRSSMKLLITAFIAFLLPLDSFAQEAPVLDGRLKKIRDTKSIAIAHRTDAAPFSFEDNKMQVTGYSVDLCRRVVGAIERQLGLSELKIKWVPVTVQNRFDAVANGQADMECGSSTVTLSRMKTVDFSSFIFVDGTGLLVKATQAAASLGDFS